ncbi:hypothetical protein [Lunatibacter salilacus]|uniref:hypothetical protein n=1 Tax=Lunatibacter salilacus TaxID=2483804 RepID=UPI00131D0EA1|nr:hypothetical protein [Lunatibacter salilacus]
MSNFLSNIIGRHTGSINSLVPTTPGIFEPRRPTPGRFNLSVPKLGNEATLANNDSNFRLDKSSMLAESSDTMEKVVERRNDKRVTPVFSSSKNKDQPKKETDTISGDWRVEQTPNENNSKSSQYQAEQEKKTNMVADASRGDGQFGQNQKVFFPTGPLKSMHQRVLERGRLEVPRDGNGVGSSSELQNQKNIDPTESNQAEQVVRPILRTEASFERNAIPRYQGSEGTLPIHSSSTNLNLYGETSQNLTVRNNLNSDQPFNAQPTIKVQIGRIEIRAIKEVPAKLVKTQTTDKRPSLDEFLKKRDNRSQ